MQKKNIYISLALFHQTKKTTYNPPNIIHCPVPPTVHPDLHLGGLQADDVPRAGVPELGGRPRVDDLPFLHPRHTRRHGLPGGRPQPGQRHVVHRGNMCVQR